MRARAIAAASALLLSATVGPAEGARLRVIAATELRLEPAPGPDADSLAVRVTLRRDEGRGLEGPVALHVRLGPVLMHELQARTDAEGRARFVVPLHGQRSVVLFADFSGTAVDAPAHAERSIDLDAPQLALELELPAVLERSAPSAAVLVRVTPLELGLSSPAGVEVQLREGERALATGRADATGRAALSLEPAALGEPGVYALHAVHERAGVRVRSDERRVVLRSPSELAMRWAAAGDEGPLAAGVLRSGAGPLEGGALRLLAGERVLAAALTDAGGRFAFDPSAEQLAGLEPGALLQVRFEPSEPWFTAVRSEPLRFVRAEPPRVRWTAPALAVALAGLAALLLRAVRGPAPSEARDEGAAPAVDAHGWERSVRPAASGEGPSVRARVRAVDRRSEGEVRAASVRWLAPPYGERPLDEAVAVRGGLECAVEVRCEGYAPRTLRVAVPSAPGTHVLRVALSPWREELLDRLRRWARARGAPRLVPTPREALAMPGLRGEEIALAELVERGAYDAAAPDAATVAQADALLVAVEPPPRRER